MSPRRIARSQAGLVAATLGTKTTAISRTWPSVPTAHRRPFQCDARIYIECSILRETFEMHHVKQRVPSWGASDLTATQLRQAHDADRQGVRCSLQTSGTQRRVPRVSRGKVRSDMNQEVVPAVVAPAAHLAGEGLGLCHVLLAVALHAVGVRHGLSTQLARVHGHAAGTFGGWRRAAPTAREALQQRRV